MPAAMRVLSSMKPPSGGEAKLALAQSLLVFLGERHGLADLLVELHADRLGTSSKYAGLGLEQEMREGQNPAGEGGKPAHHHQQIAGAQRTPVVVQHLDHHRALLAILHGGTVEAEMVP